MSTLRVDPLTFSTILHHRVEVLIKEGYSVTGAYAIAREEIADSFVCDPFLSIIEDQKDTEDERTTTAR